MRDELGHKLVITLWATTPTEAVTLLRKMAAAIEQQAAARKGKFPKTVHVTDRVTPLTPNSVLAICSAEPIVGIGSYTKGNR